MTSQYPSSAPPGYSDSAAEPLLVSNGGFPGSSPTAANPESNAASRAAGDNIPDDFKYGVFVSECDVSIRKAFVRKVYTILSCQILATVALSSAFIFSESLSHWALLNTWAFYTCMVLSLVTMFAAYYKARDYPVNLVFLSLFTLTEAYTVGFVTALFDTNIVVQAFAITVAVFLGLTFIATFSKYDFTKWQGYAFAGVFFLLGLGMVQLFVPFSSTMELLYSGAGALIFSVYILIDTQLIMSHFYPEDEVIAAINLYLDVINLFLYILRILQETNDN